MPGGKAGLGNENPGGGLRSDMGGGTVSGRDVALLPEVGRGVGQGSLGNLEVIKYNSVPVVLA